MYFGCWSLRNEVQDVGAGPTETDDPKPLSSESAGDGSDFGATGGSVDVMKDRVVIIGRNRWKHLGGDGLVERLSRPGDDSYVLPNLIVVISVAVRGL